jgi:hypothetical protein
MKQKKQLLITFFVLLIFNFLTGPSWGEFVDNCPDNCNTQQLDADEDGLGDVCDPDPGCGGCGGDFCEEECTQEPRIENLVPYSEDFQESTWFLFGDPTVIQFNGFQGIYQNTTDATLVKSSSIANSGGKNLSLIVKCVPLVNAALIGLRLSDTGDNATEEDRLPNDRFSYLRVNTALPTESAVFFQIENSDNATKFRFMIEYVHMYEQLPPALYNNGDSIAFAAHIYTLTPSKSNSYAALYANKYHINYVQKAIGGEILDQIRPRVVADLLGATYPIIFLEGGANDILQAESDPNASMQLNMELMISSAKSASNNILIIKVPSFPAWNTEPEKQGWANTYNAWIDSTYGSDSEITIIDISNYLLTADYTIGGLHPNLNGHVKIFEAIDFLIDSPLDVETYSYVKTEETGILAE